MKSHPAENIHNRDFSIVLKPHARLLEVVEDTTKAILGMNAYDNQVEYLKTMKKPRKLSVDEWMRRIQNINFYLVNMEN